MILNKGNIKLAIESVQANSGRSLLTMLGIIIGVAAVIIVISIGEGVKSQIAQQTTRFGKDVLVVHAGGGGGGVVNGMFGQNTRPLSNEDIETIRTTENVASTVPLSIVVGAVKADREVNNPLVIATSADFVDVAKHPIEYGGFFDAIPDSKTAVLGPGIAQQLFEDSVPLGQSFEFRGQSFMVAGVFERFAAPPLSVESDYNDAIFIPYTSARSVLGADPATYQVLAKVKENVDVEKTSKTIQERLIVSHGGAEDVVVESVSTTHGIGSSTLDLLTIMMIGVAIISFLVGGVGIMNIMLVSVTERTQEVGIRKAIGATNSQIMNQFMAEALVLSVSGALLGLFIASIVIVLLRLYSTLQPIFVWEVMVIAPIAAIITGVIFGTFPAIKAARKDPIESLRRQF